MRMQLFPPAIHPPENVEIIRAAIPDFHIITHGVECLSMLDTKCISGVGRLCGEGTKTEWSIINQAANSIREISPSARNEELSDHLGYLNWKRIKDFGRCLPVKDVLTHISL